MRKEKQTRVICTDSRNEKQKCKLKRRKYILQKGNIKAIKKVKMGKKEIDRSERAYKHYERKIRRNEEVNKK